MIGYLKKIVVFKWLFQTKKKFISYPQQQKRIIIEERKYLIGLNVTIAT